MSTLEDIKSVKYTNRDYSAISSIIENCEYTTVVLAALAAWLRDNDDLEGSQLMVEFANRFAEHEAQALESSDFGSEE